MEFCKHFWSHVFTCPECRAALTHHDDLLACVDDKVVAHVREGQSEYLSRLFSVLDDAPLTYQTEGTLC